MKNEIVLKLFPKDEESEIFRNILNAHEDDCILKIYS